MTSINAEITSETVERLKLGDHQAFALIYRHLKSPLMNYLIRVTGRREMAEEIHQETFITVVKKIDFLKDAGGFRSWVFRIATHRTIDLMRSKKTHQNWLDQQNSSEPLTPSAEEFITKSEFTDRTQRALDSLTPSQRMIFLLKTQEELDCLEISKIVGCSQGAVKQSLFRTRNTLRKALSS